MSGFYLALSTSSPQSSVAFFDTDWNVIWEGAELAPRAATGACCRLIEAGLARTGLSLADGLAFGADLGPGSFTGVRVGVMMAKSLAFANGCPTFGASAFDLISVSETVSVPSRKGEWWVREPGQEPERRDQPVGEAYPLASRFSLLPRPVWVAAEELLPLYFAEPSISTPKRPYGLATGGTV